MLEFCRETLSVLREASIYLLAGFALAGLLYVLLERYQPASRLVAVPGKRGVFLAALFGLPMPLCSCSVLPAALTLRRRGASKGATASFLVSVPETDVVSIVLTYVLLGPLLAIYRPIAALVTAVTTGLVVQRVGGEGDEAASPPRGDSDVRGAGHGSVSAEPSPDRPRAAPGKAGGWLREALHFGFGEMFDDIVGQLLIGIVVAGALLAWLPVLGLDRISGDSPLVYLIMLAIGIPLYVCASASTPVAAGLVAGGVSPGAALVFLLAGPATNTASLLVLGRHFGRRALGAYLSCIAAVSLAMGLLFDLLPSSDIPTRRAVESVAQPDGSVVGWAATAVFLALAAASMRRTRLIERSVSKWIGAAGRLLGSRIGREAGTASWCRNAAVCSGGHRHGPGCGHERVPHAGHLDYAVDGHLHHPHGDHCDDHGPVELAAV